MNTLRNIVVLAATVLPFQLSYGQTYIQVEGNKANALKLLKAGGITAKETSNQKFAPPVVTIGGNDGPVDLGEQVILTADFDSDKLPDGLVSMTFNWTVLDEGKQKKFFAADGGKEIAFGVGVKPKKMVVILDVNCLFESKQKFVTVDKDGKNPVEREFITEVQTASPTPIFSEIVIGGGPSPDPSPTPNPTPNPTPVPTPTPTFPDGQFGLAKFMYSSFMSDSSLDSKSKVILASKLADGLEGIASQINALSTYRDVSTILADTKKANDDAFTKSGVDVSKTTALKAVVKDKVKELWNGQKINNAIDISTAWQEMSQGLRAVK